jgi:two-component system NarL family response regulator
MHRCRILVVDDSPIFLAATAALLDRASGIEVVGTARSGREAIERVPELEPDLVLMDLEMPEMSGLEAARHLAERPHRPRVVTMTAHEDEEYRAAALAAPVDGFVFKSDLGLQLVPLIHALLPECGGDAVAGGL